jgi:hypothetical protein
MSTTRYRIIEKDSAPRTEREARLKRVLATLDGILPEDVIPTLNSMAVTLIGNAVAPDRAAQALTDFAEGLKRFAPQAREVAERVAMLDGPAGHG